MSKVVLMPSNDSSGRCSSLPQRIGKRIVPGISNSFFLPITWFAVRRGRSPAAVFDFVMFIDPTRDYDQECRKGPRVSGNRAAVDDNDLAVHKTVSVASHERGVFGKFGRAPETSLRNPKVVHLQETVGQSVAEIGVEDPGSDRVDGDAEVGSLA